MSSKVMLRRLLAVVPWKSKDWRHRGVRAYTEETLDDGTIRIDEQVVYMNPSERDPDRPYLNEEERLAWQVAITTNRVLEKRFRLRQGRYERVEETNHKEESSD